MKRHHDYKINSLGIHDMLVKSNPPIISFKIAWWVLAISSLFILLVGEFTKIDLMIEDYYYDTSLKTFPWKNVWFAKVLMHIYIKNVILSCGFVLYLVLLIDMIKPLHIISGWLRFRLRFIATASVIIPVTISLLKKYSVLHCPWDIDRYNGTAPFMKLLDYVPKSLEAGACFPGGHASTGLWLASLCVFWLPNNSNKAQYVFTLGLGTGFILGWVQQMRGAHFLFHTLWSMWIASFIILLMLQVSNISHKY
jgi:membrane-associated PAP2 superfamily phosphatase